MKKLLITIFAFAFFSAPSVVAGWKFRKDLAVGIGIFGPPGVGKYAFPDPTSIYEEGDDYARVDSATGQRDMLIDADMVIAYPSLGVAWQAHDMAFYGHQMTVEVPLSHQERAYTSPIWYTP